MASPKNKKSKMRKRQRVGQLEKAILASVQTCPSCGGLKQTHHVCPTCGKNLNEGPCACVHEERDDRWGALDALLPGEKN